MTIFEFDARAMHAAMDAQRIALGLSWSGVARAMWEQSAVLNARRADHPISPATLTGIAQRGDCTCQHALFILRWLACAPEAFLVGPSRSAATGLPAAGEDRRLRWNLKAVSRVLDARRRERDMSWDELARTLQCTKSQVTGIRRARYAIGMRLMMRIVQWLEVSSATFIYSAEW